MDSLNCFSFVIISHKVTHSTSNCTYPWNSPPPYDDKACRWSSSHYNARNIVWTHKPHFMLLIPQHFCNTFFPHTNFELQLKVVMKQQSTTLSAPWTFNLIGLFFNWTWQTPLIRCQKGSYFKNFMQQMKTSYKSSFCSLILCI